MQQKVWKWEQQDIDRHRQCTDLIRESKVFIKYKVSVASRVCTIEKGVFYLIKLLFKSDEEKCSFWRVRMSSADIQETLQHVQLFYIWERLDIGW